jgi:divinyl chlorophyllide a 8-vinyl-reductase
LPCSHLWGIHPPHIHRTQAYDADATPSYGTDTLEGFFAKALKEGLKGQELGDQAVFGVGE